MKWMSMGTRKLFKPSQEFFLDKLQPSMDLGLSRIEYSTYFHSFDDWKAMSQDLSVLDSLI